MSFVKASLSYTWDWMRSITNVPCQFFYICIFNNRPYHLSAWPVHPESEQANVQVRSFNAIFLACQLDERQDI